MQDEERLRIYSAMADASRAWVASIDAKANFLSAMNAGVLTFIWTGARWTEGELWAQILALTASFFSIISLLAAIWVFIPRIENRRNFPYRSRLKVMSFFGYIAVHYQPEECERFFKDVNAMSAAELSQEHLEQHFIISHLLWKKARLVRLAGITLMLALTLVCIALTAEEIFLCKHAAESSAMNLVLPAYRKF